MPDQYPGTIKYKKHKNRLNIGIIICIIVVLYFLAYFCDFIFNKKNNLYEVVQGSTSTQFDGQYTGLILRSEKIVPSEASGYVNFFVGDTVPVFVGERAYMIDRSGELSAMLHTAAQTQAVLNENDLTVLKDTLYGFHSSFQPDDYYETYHFRYQLESQILELVNNSILDNAVLNDSSQVFYSAYAGIAVHYVDGFEELTTDTFEASSFRKTNYNKHIIRSNDFVEAGSPVYKVITSEDWQLIFQISDPQTFADPKGVITIEFLKDGITTDAAYEVVTRGGYYYCIIHLDKYMIRYASDRYLRISLAANNQEGLRIPKTAYTKQVFYAIPVTYKAADSDAYRTGFTVQTKDENGSEITQIRYPRIVKETEDLYYISTSDSQLSAGDIVLGQDPSNIFRIGMSASLGGVYVYNGGNTTFALTEIIGENDGYYIVKDNTPRGVRMYDQVYTYYSDAEEK